MSTWIECLISIRFDLDKGPSVEYVLPHNALSEAALAKIIQCAFPDSNKSVEHNYIYSFNMRDCTRAGERFYHVDVPSSSGGSSGNGGGSASIDTAGTMSAIASSEIICRVASCMTSSGTTQTNAAGGGSHMFGHSTHTHPLPAPVIGARLAPLYGTTYYREKQDPQMRRSYVQQAVVLLSRLPYIAIHELILRVVVARFCQCCAFSPDTERVDVASMHSPRSTCIFPVDCSFNEYVYTQEQVLEEAVRQIASWPSPHPRARYNVMLLYQSLDFVTPSHTLRWPLTAMVVARQPAKLDGRVKLLPMRRYSKKHPQATCATRCHKSLSAETKKEASYTHSADSANSSVSTSRPGSCGGAVGFDDCGHGVTSLACKLATSRSAGAGEVERMPELLPVYGLLATQLTCLTQLWELLISHEPILIFSPSPVIASSTAHAVASLVAPLEYNGVLRPYITVQDEDLGRYTRLGQALPFSPSKGMIVAVTNPFIVRQCVGWTNVLTTNEPYLSLASPRSVPSRMWPTRGPGAAAQSSGGGSSSNGKVINSAHVRTLSALGDMDSVRANDQQTQQQRIAITRGEDKIGPAKSQLSQVSSRVEDGCTERNENSNAGGACCTMMPRNRQQQKQQQQYLSSIHDVDDAHASTEGHAKYALTLDQLSHCHGTSHALLDQSGHSHISREDRSMQCVHRVGHDHVQGDHLVAAANPNEVCNGAATISGGCPTEPHERTALDADGVARGGVEASSGNHRSNGGGAGVLNAVLSSIITTSNKLCSFSAPYTSSPSSSSQPTQRSFVRSAMAQGRPEDEDREGNGSYAVVSRGEASQPIQHTERRLTANVACAAGKECNTEVQLCENTCVFRASCAPTLQEFSQLKECSSAQEWCTYTTVAGNRSSRDQLQYYRDHCHPNEPRQTVSHLSTQELRAMGSNRSSSHKDSTTLCRSSGMEVDPMHDENILIEVFETTPVSVANTETVEQQHTIVSDCRSNDEVGIDSRKKEERAAWCDEVRNARSKNSSAACVLLQSARGSGEGHSSAAPPPPPSTRADCSSCDRAPSRGRGDDASYLLCRQSGSCIKIRSTRDEISSRRYGVEHEAGSACTRRELVPHVLQLDVPDTKFASASLRSDANTLPSTSWYSAHAVPSLPGASTWAEKEDGIPCDYSLLHHAAPHSHKRCVSASSNSCSREKEKPPMERFATPQNGLTNRANTHTSPIHSSGQTVDSAGSFRVQPSLRCCAGRAASAERVRESVSLRPTLAQECGPVSSFLCSGHAVDLPRSAHAFPFVSPVSRATTLPSSTLAHKDAGNHEEMGEQQRRSESVPVSSAMNSNGAVFTVANYQALLDSTQSTASPRTLLGEGGQKTAWSRKVASLADRGGTSHSLPATAASLPTSVRARTTSRVTLAATSPTATAPVSRLDSRFPFLLDHEVLTKTLLQRLGVVCRLDVSVQRESVALNISEWCGCGEAELWAAVAQEASASTPSAQQSPQRQPQSQRSQLPRLPLASHLQSVDVDEHMRVGRLNAKNDGCAADLDYGDLSVNSSSSSMLYDTTAAAAAASTSDAFVSADTIAQDNQDCTAATSMVALFSSFTVADDIVRKFFISLTTEFLSPLALWFTAATADLSSFELCDRSMMETELSAESFLRYLNQHRHTITPAVLTRKLNHKQCAVMYQKFARGSLFLAFVVHSIETKLYTELAEFDVRVWQQKYSVPIRTNMFAKLYKAVERELIHVLDPAVLFVQRAIAVLREMASTFDNPLHEHFLASLNDLKL